MDELELVRLHEDGERLVLGGTGGAQYSVAITEALRAAVRRDRPHLEHLRAEGESRLAPREIQARLRGGDTVEEVADAAGLPPEHVRRFAGPVEAEQDYVVRRVRSSREGRDDHDPTLGELVEGRLTARDVDVAGARWSATRTLGSPWIVELAFEAGSGGRTARWTYDPSTRVPHALDDEARWLSEPESAPDPVPGTAAVFDVDAGPRGPRAAQAAEPDGTGELLDDLSQRRGVRARTASEAVPGQEPFEGFGPTRSAGPAGGAGDDRQDTRVGTVVPLQRITRGEVPPGPTAGSPPPDAGQAAPARPPADDPPPAVDEPPRPRPADPREARKGKNRSRAKVPSWDEIVFGARPEG
ncbi:DUF3071 domain-containing protein [Cellulosimicrobium terreum]|nr:DUF3071 domain-containing protein [Cellulosimicrobium terreum]